MTEDTKRLPMAGLLEAVVNVPDPRDRLRRIRSLEEGISKLGNPLRDLKRKTILELRELDPRPTWAEIGEELGVSGQRAEQLAR